MQSDPWELITVDACNAGTKTLHRQHNSSSRNQSGSTQLYPAGLAGTNQPSSAAEAFRNKAPVVMTTTFKHRNVNYYHV